MNNLKYAVLGSGSSANAYIFENNDFSIIIDNGFSCQKLMLRAKQLNFDINKVKSILLTHSHQDHFKGVETLSRKLKVPVVVHEDLNLKTKLKSHLYKRINIRPGIAYSEGDFSFKAFATSHDADYSISYHFTLGGVAFTIITDTGVVNEEMQNLASVSDILFIEANYNEQMLYQGPYPLFLKERITSPFGHLSNKDAIYFLNDIGNREGTRLKKVFFCHLSSTNNRKNVLEDDIKKHLTWKGNWVICPKGEPVACN